LSKRGLKIALHWAVVLSILAMVEGGTANTIIRTGFSGLVLIWLALALSGGVLGLPGPKLTGVARDLYRPMHLALYLLLGLTALVNAGELLNLLAPGLTWTLLLILLTFGTFHAIFHLWRHTTLYDGALRLITPQFMHKHL
jgi:superoxide oxidase